MSNVDYPIDQLSDDNIKYLNAKKALNLRCKTTVTNSKGIWLLKFWFSIERGFLGYTATGNEEREVEQYHDSKRGQRVQQKFTDSDLSYIKENITPTGEIWPVSDYSKLKTGDTVIGNFDGSTSQRYIGMAKIFVDSEDNNRTYAIQAVADGSSPGSTEWRNYRQYGSKSWWLYDSSELGSDHCKLHYWRPSSTELTCIESPVKEVEKEVEKEEDPLSWNLPVSNRFSFSSWGRGSSISRDSIREADFALVLYYDDLVNPEKDALVYERPSDTRKQRKEEKEGATKLISDEEIKKMNIERYIQKLTVSLKITETEFFNLEKIISKHLCQEFSFISVFYQRPDWTDISDFTEYLYQVVDSSEDEKSYYLNRAKDLYSGRIKTYYNSLLKYQMNKKFIKGDGKMKLIFDEIFKLGTEINSSFAKKEINSIDDLWMTMKKIRAFYDYSKMSRNQLSYQVREVMGAFRYTDEIENHFTHYENQYTNEEYNRDIEKINRIKAFLKSL